MIPELGHFALILALLVAVVQGIFPLWGTLNGNVGWQSLARASALLQALLVSLAFACLASAFLANDFSVVYVTQHSNTLLPCGVVMRGRCCCGSCSWRFGARLWPCFRATCRWPWWHACWACWGWCPSVF
jgi:hypothetical protein